MLASCRIAHVAPVILPVPPLSYGGTERVVADLARAQAALGHEPVIFAGSDSSIDLPLRSGFRSLSDHRGEGTVPPGLAAELEAAQLAELLRAGDAFDIVHLHGSAHASALCQTWAAPVFRTIHWRADEEDHRQHFRQFPEERVVAISHAQAEDMPQSSLAGVVHHGIPVDRLREGRGAGGYLAFIGRMTDQKRPDRAIELASRAGLPLQLAGPVDPGNPDYFDRVVAAALSSSIRHVGSIDDRAKQSFLGEALALLFPIDWPEPFGLVMIEAMACGTPVIAWAKGSVPEIVEDGVTGVVVQSLDEALARLPEVLALDRGRVRQCFEARFTATRMAQDTCALYNAVLQGSELSASALR